MDRTDRKEHEESLSLMAQAGLAMIKWYQKWLSPVLGANCRFRPTCSHYTYEAIARYGFFKGCWMGFWRILRCNPFSRGGDDPVN